MPTSPQPSGIVTFKVKIEGTELPGTFQVFSIVVKKEVNRIPRATVSFIDGSVAGQEFELSNDTKLEPGKAIEIMAGYDANDQSIFKGIIVKHSVKIRRGTAFTLIECKDKAVKMTTERKTEQYEKQKDSDIIKKLTGNSSVSGTVDATTFKHPKVIQFDSTDWDFAVMRAELNSMVVLANDNKVNVKKPETASPVLTLAYGKDIIEFEADIDASTQYSSVAAKAYSIEKKAVEESSGSASVSEAGNLSSSKLAGTSASTGNFTLFHSAHLTPTELKDWSSAKLMKSKMAKLRGRVTCFGFAGITTGDTIEVQGVSQRFNGKLYVSGVAHQISEGNWTTTVQFGLSPGFFAETTANVQPQPAGGLFPSVHGLQAGSVSQIHEDPEGEVRVQVKLPLLGADTTVWARMVFSDAGPERGLCFFPEVGDEVIVGFLHSDGRYPVILGSLYSSKTKAPWPPAKKNDEKGITTREKLKIHFNDKDKIITIETPGGQKMLLDDKEKGITLEDTNSNKVILDSKGITLNSGKDVKIEAKGKITLTTSSGDVSAEGVNVKLAAKSQFKAEGKAGAEVSSSAMLTLKGSMTKIN